MSQHIVSTNPDVIEKIRTEADYFERNAERMRYPTEQRKTVSVTSRSSLPRRTSRRTRGDGKALKTTRVLGRIA